MPALCSGAAGSLLLASCSVLATVALNSWTTFPITTRTLELGRSPCGRSPTRTPRAHQTTSGFTHPPATRLSRNSSSIANLELLNRCYSNPRASFAPTTLFYKF
ncbi:hypothetical protein DFH06DRAFT_1248472 [Mycena polygramma]|nr:hypothetical protein DFH06DRAFT_1248472 [Mycena polygramma]